MELEIFSGRDQTLKVAKKSMILGLLVVFFCISEDPAETNELVQFRGFFHFFIGMDFIVQIFQEWQKTCPFVNRNNKIFFNANSDTHTTDGQTDIAT